MFVLIFPLPNRMAAASIQYINFDANARATMFVFSPLSHIYLSNGVHRVVPIRPAANALRTHEMLCVARRTVRARITNQSELSRYYIYTVYAVAMLYAPIHQRRAAHTHTHAKTRTAMESMMLINVDRIWCRGRRKRRQRTRRMRCERESK